MSVKMCRKKRYVTLQWPLDEITVNKLTSYSELGTPPNNLILDMRCPDQSDFI